MSAEIQHGPSWIFWPNLTASPSTQLAGLSRLRDVLMKTKIFLPLLPLLLLSTLIWAQDNSATPMYPANPHPDQAPATDQDAAPQQMNHNTGQDMPVFRVNVFARTTKAVNYRHRGGSTIVDFRGTDLMPEVGGHA